MRKSYLILSGLAAASTLAFATTPEVMELPLNFDPMNLNFSFPIEKLNTDGKAKRAETPAQPAKKGMMKQIRKADAKQYEMFVAAQTYQKDYAFNYDGGDVTTYDITVTVDGNTATISNFFNLEAQSTDWSKGVDYDVTGVYDPDAKTITIPVSDNIDNATICGTIGDYYTEILMAGTVNEDNKMTNTRDLVLNVVGDFEALTTDMDFGIMHWTEWGGLLGTQTMYRKFHACVPTEEPRLMAFNNSYDFGETYPNTPTERSMTIVNISDTDVDYVIDVEADEDAFKAEPFAGVANARSAFDVTFTLDCPVDGEFEGLATISYEGIDADPDPIEVLMFGTVIPYPDYSAVVTGGEFNLTTGIDYPFEITTLEDGTTVARSTINGRYGKSFLSAEFEVPAGHIGTFSWKGESTNVSYWYQNAGGLFVDTMDSAYKAETGTADISGSIELAPGKHFVRFQYDGYYYTGDEKNGMYVYDLNLELAAAPAVGVEVATPEVNLGNFLIRDENGVEGYGTIRLLNRGIELLTVSSVSSDKEEITAQATQLPAELLEYVEIPVTLKAIEPGKIDATVTIETSAGEVKANVSALVRKMADFSQVVTEGIELVTSFDTDTQNPFEVVDGVAFNSNSGTPDDTPYVTSWFKINFTVPAGKAAHMSWDGHFDGQLNEENPYAADYANVEYQHPMNSGTGPYILGNVDAGSETVFADDFWHDKLVCIPGDHYLKFNYNRNGDGIISERDLFEIYNVRFVVEDFPEHGVKADTEELTFDDIYVGYNRYSTAVVKLTNTGSEPLQVLDVEADHPFYGVFYENATAQWNNTMEVGVWFYPSEEGKFEGTVVFKTTGGDVPVHCYGGTKAGEGILLIGDVEDEAAGWSFYDADGDGECWNLGYNMWGQMPAYVHEGNDCFGSASYSYYNGYIEPDNWLFSPVVSIPESGAKLRWYAASHHRERYAENYSVYVEEADVMAEVVNLDEFDPVFSETLEPESADVWVENVVDLDAYAGQDICIAFRHHDCNGQFVLKIDDIFVYTNDRWDTETGVKAVGSDSKAVSTEIFDINGIRRSTLSEGVNIVRVTRADGTVTSHKIMLGK